ncbi:MAG: hypothetical protein ACRD8Z_29285, partial [Nitrososphaeraceae archaeon]
KESRLTAVNPGPEGLAAKGSPDIPTPGISDGVVVDVSDGDPVGGVIFAFIREIRGSTIIIFVRFRFVGIVVIIYSIVF